MSTENDRNREQDIGVEDVAEVGSRVSWGAIFAGAAVAVAVCLVLGLLGTAVGLTVADGADAETIGWGTGLWAILTMLIALFAGGWIASQCSVGELPMEAAVHGIIVWGVTLAILLFLAAGGFNLGMATTMAGAPAAGRVVVQDPAAAVIIDQDAPAAAQPAERAEQNRETAMQAAWWSLVGALLSIAAAIGGAMAGAGPTPRLMMPGFAVYERRTYRRGAMPGGT